MMPRCRDRKCTTCGSAYSHEEALDSHAHYFDAPYHYSQGVKDHCLACWLGVGARDLLEIALEVERDALEVGHGSQPTGDMVTTKVIELRGRLSTIAEQLGGDELAALEMVAAGLARGRAVYGELRVDLDHRDFRAEATAEIRDSLAYLAAELVRLQRSR